MAKKATKASQATTKRAATSKKPAGPRKKRPVVAASTKVDYYPNRMTVAISALAGTLLVLIALIAVLGGR